MAKKKDASIHLIQSKEGRCRNRISIWKKKIDIGAIFNALSINKITKKNSKFDGDR